jgi:hypothetical protein
MNLTQITIPRQQEEFKKDTRQQKDQIREERPHMIQRAKLIIVFLVSIVTV